MFFIYLLLIIHTILYGSWSNSLVTIRLDPQIIFNYYRHTRFVSIHPPVAVISLYDHDLLNYCHQLRNSSGFHAVDTGGSWTDPVPATVFHIQKLPMKMEKDAIGLKALTKFRVANSNQTLTQQSFQCLDVDGEMKWFVTAAFVPDSAFLFTAVQPNYNFLSRREINSMPDIPARLEAVIDASATVLEDTESKVVDIVGKSILLSNSSTRDHLCDLNRIIQYRICVIAADAIDNYFIAHSNVSSQQQTESVIYESRTRNQYYWERDPEENCRVVSPTIRNRLKLTSTNKYRKMLHCFVKIQMYTRNQVFFLTLNMLDRTKAAIIHPVTIRQLQIPLLKHLDQYETVLQNFTF